MKNSEKDFVMRFDEMLDFIGISAYRLAKDLETSSSVISSIRSGKTKPGFELLSRIVSKYDLVNINYVLTGKWQIAVKSPSKSTVNPPSKSSFSTEFSEKNAIEGVSTQPYAQVNAHPTAHPTHKKGYKIPELPPTQTEEATALYQPKMPSIVTVNEHGIDNILYVPIKAQAGYLIGYGDQEYIESLESFRMPGLNNKTFRMFEVEGISMSPTLMDKDRVIAEWVPSLDEIRENRIHVIVLRNGVLIKRVLNRLKKRNKIYLKSDTVTHRQDYRTEEVNPEDITEIWYVHMKVSSDLSEPSEIYTRLADLEINQLEILKKLGMNPIG